MKLFIFVMSLVCSLCLGKGIRTGGNGGGFGEMKALLLWKTMDQHLRLCLPPASLCGLTSDETLFVQKILPSFPDERLYGGIDFFNDPQMTRTVETKNQIGDKISINSALLSEPGGLSRSLQSIGTWILWGVFRHHQIEAAHIDLLPLAKRIYSYFAEDVSTQKIGSYPNYLLLHRLNIHLNKTQNFFQERLIIEDKTASYDLLSDQKVRNFCGKQQSPQFQIEKITSVQGGTLLIVQLSWSCNGTSWGSALLSYKLIMDSDSVLQYPIPIEIRGVTNPESGV